MAACGEALPLVAILLLASVLRLGWPTLSEFKFSEARLEALALELTREGRLPLVGVPSSAGFDHSPVSVYLYAPPFLLTNHPVPATLYGGLVNVAAVFLVYWLGGKWRGGGRRAAVVGALLFAVSPWSVVCSRKIWQVVFVPPLTLAFIECAIGGLVEGRQWRLAWAVVVYAVLVQVHPSALSLAPALLLWGIAFRRKLKLRPLLLGGALASLTAVPFLLSQMQRGWPVLAALRLLPVAKWDLQSLHLAWDAITGRGLHTLAGASYPLLWAVPSIEKMYNLSGWLVVVATGGLTWRVFRNWRSSRASSKEAAEVDSILVTWLLTPIAFNLRHGLDLYLHFMILVSPAAFLLVGRAAEALRGAAPPWRLRRGLLSAMWFAVAALAGGQVVGLALMARHVASHETQGGFGTPLRRYLAVSHAILAEAQQAGAAEILVVGEGDSPVVDETAAIFDVLLRGQWPTRFVDGRSTALFPAQPAVVLLTPGAEDAEEWYRPWPATDLGGGYRALGLSGSWPQEGLGSIMGPRLFQNGVEFQGYVWQVSAPDQRWRAWLLWQVLWRDPQDTHFFLRVVDETGKPWGQRDTAGYPVSNRHKGDRVLSAFDITPAPGQIPDMLWAQAGQYSYPEVINVPVIDLDGRPVADAVTFGPLGGTQR